MNLLSGLSEYTPSAISLFMALVFSFVFRISSQSPRSDLDSCRARESPRQDTGHSINNNKSKVGGAIAPNTMKGLIEFHMILFLIIHRAAERRGGGYRPSGLWR